jgi:hypothetical protein
VGDRHLRAGVRADAGVHGAHITDNALDDEVRFEACENRRIFRLHFTIASDRLVPRRTTRHLDAPRLDDLDFLRRGL